MRRGAEARRDDLPPAWALATALSVLASLAWLAWQGSIRNAVSSGDAHAVYGPVAEALLDGRGLASFAFLAHGVGRMPGYPALLALPMSTTGDLGAAARAIGLAAAAIALSALVFVLVRARVSPTFLPLAVVITAINPVFARAVFEPLPDMC